VNLELPNQCTVEDCIIQTIKYLNHQFKVGNVAFFLNENYRDYEVFHARKNGKPKEDYPCKFFVN